MSRRQHDARNTDVICDDQVMPSLRYSTQWDSFAHVGSWFDADGDGEPEKVYDNGHRAHEHCLFKLGIPLGGLWWQQDLAAWLRAHGRHRCLLTAPPLRLPSPGDR